MATGPESMGNKGAGDRTTGSSQVKQGLEQARQKASDTAKEARHRGKERLEKGKDAAADQVGQLAGAVEDVAGKLSESNSTFASYASDLGRRMSEFADGLHNRSVEELADEARGLARRNPTLFLLGSVALGVALSRFVKASARRSRMERQGADFNYAPRSRGEPRSDFDHASFAGEAPSQDSSSAREPGSGSGTGPGAGF